MQINKRVFFTVLFILVLVTAFPAFAEGENEVSFGCRKIREKS